MLEGPTEPGDDWTPQTRAAPLRQPPPMRVVTQGGLVQSERAVRLDVLRRYDTLAVRGRLRGRAWWKPYNRRWTVSTLGWTHRAVVGLALVAGGVITSLILVR